MTGDDQGASRPAFRDLRARMAAVGFFPSKTRGQNFLLDPAAHAAIAAAALVGPGDVVLEIGTGLGFLTSALLATGADVVSVEIDDRLHGLARQLLAEGTPPQGVLDLVHADALGPDGLAPAVTAALDHARARRGAATFTVAGNLPYSVSGPLVAALCCHEPLPRRMVLLLQKEMADRVVAGAGSRTYGTLSALSGVLYRGRLLRRVPPGAFQPRPNVDSAVLRLDAIEGCATPVPSAAERRGFARFLRALFAGRRKTLRNALARAFPGDSPPDSSPVLAALGILSAIRPEACPPDRLLSLYRALAQMQGPAAAPGPHPPCDGSP